MRPAFVLVGFFSVVIAGCARAGGPAGPGETKVPAPVARPESEYCAAIYDKAFACASPHEKLRLAELRDEVMTACRDREVRGTLLEKAELMCAQQATCEEYRACRVSLREAKAMQLLETALASDEGLKDPWTICEVAGFTNEATLRSCREARVRLVEHETREVTALRDDGDDAFARCLDLKSHAVRLSAEEGARAEALCAEAEASARAQEALDEVRKHLAAGTLEVPFQCSMAVEEFEPLSSAWAKGRLREVLQGCYVELGKRILPARVPHMRICEYYPEQVYIAVKTFALADPALDPWIARADKKCAKSLRR